MDKSLESLDQIRALVLDMGVRFGPKLVVAIVILIAGYLVARWAGGLMDRGLVRLKLDPPVRQLLLRIGRLFVIALFAIVALQNLGVELLPLIAGLGVAGAGIALAMQGVLGNVVAGLTLIFSRPFHIGDYISIAKEEGEVLELGLFNTTLGHLDRSRVVIPNRKIVGEILHNYGQIRQLTVMVNVSYGTDVNAALALIDETLRSNPRVLQDPVPWIGVSRFADFGVSIRVSPWVKVRDYDNATSEINTAILEAFRARDIVIPLPQREVRLLGGGTRVPEPSAAAGSTRS